MKDETRDPHSRPVAVFGCSDPAHQKSRTIACGACQKIELDKLLRERKAYREALRTIATMSGPDDLKGIAAIWIAQQVTTGNLDWAKDLEAISKPIERT